MFKCTFPSHICTTCCGSSLNHAPWWREQLPISHSCNSSIWLQELAADSILDWVVLYLPLVNVCVLREYLNVVHVIRNPNFFFRFVYVIFPSLIPAVPPVVPPSSPVSARDSSGCTSHVPRLQPANLPAAPVSPRPQPLPPQLPDPSLPGISLLRIPAAQ